MMEVKKKKILNNGGLLLLCNRCTYEGLNDRWNNQNGVYFEKSRYK